MTECVIVGLGQMGATFAHGLLRLGRTVHPLNRGESVERLAARVPQPEVVLLAVGESALPGVLASLPASYRPRVALLQNELMPEDWGGLGIARPTVANVWFERKPNKPITEILPTPIAGPRAGLLVEALSTIGIGARAIPDDGLDELALKSLYILTANIAGLEVGGTVGALWTTHRAVADAVAAEVLAVLTHRAGRPLSSVALIAKLGRAFEADPEHACTGRSAPARLARLLTRADQAGVSVPTIRRIGAATTG